MHERRSIRTNHSAQLNAPRIARRFVIGQGGPVAVGRRTRLLAILGLIFVTAIVAFSYDVAKPEAATQLTRFGDWGYKTPDPSAVSYVTLNVSNSSNALVSTRQENYSPYCAFGDSGENAKQCNVPNLVPGVYKVDAIAFGRDGSTTSARHSVTVDGEPLPTRTPIATATAPPSATVSSTPAASPTAQPTATVSPTPAASPTTTASATPSATPLTAILQLSRFGDWGYKALDPLIVSYVTLDVYNSSNERINNRRENYSPYCAFGDAGPPNSECYVPNLPAGTYKVVALATAKDSSTTSAQHIVTVGNTPSPTSTPSPAPSSGVRINVGDNWQTVVDAHAPGTVFLIASGVHKRQKVTPKDGQGFIGDIGAVMDGENARDFAFRGGAKDVTIRGLVIEHYASPLQHGAIHADGPGWTIDGNEIRFNAAAAIYGNDGSKITANRVHHQGQIGIKARGQAVLIEGNEIAFNNTRNIDPGWEAGGTKFVLTKNLVVRNNYVHDNAGPGLWTDIDNIYTTYEGNRVENNSRIGIFHEISYDAVIRNNQVQGNGFGFHAWLWGSQIVVANSSNVEVYGNVVKGINGIGLIQQNRGSGNYGPHLTRNNYVHHNDVTLSASDSRTGLVADYDVQGALSSNNRFDFNTYHGVSASGWHWHWNSPYTFQGFNSQGQEPAGSVLP